MMTRLGILGAVLVCAWSGAAMADQVLNCREVAYETRRIVPNGNRVQILLTNEGAPRINQVKGRSKITGFWKESSRLGRGEWSMTRRDEDRKSFTVFFDDVEAPQMSYWFTLRRELLGAEFKAEQAEFWIDPDYPDGGGHPVHLVCASRLR